MHGFHTFSQWMHHLHDTSVKAAHFTGHLLHEKSFWGIVAIIALIAALFTLAMLYGTNASMKDYMTPMPYAPYM